MDIGDVLECAVWLTGEEAEGHLTRSDDPPLNDTECDYVINALGPEAAMRAVREAVDARALN